MRRTPVGVCVVIVAGALFVGCGEDKPTYGGGFESEAECITGWATLDPDLSRAERVAKCGGGGAEAEDDDPQDDDAEWLTCPKPMEVIAERRGGGFVRGTDPEYDPRMDWDGDGVSCE